MKRKTIKNIVLKNIIQIRLTKNINSLNDLIEENSLLEQKQIMIDKLLLKIENKRPLVTIQSEIDKLEQFMQILFVPSDENENPDIQRNVATTCNSMITEPIKQPHYYLCDLPVGGLFCLPIEGLLRLPPVPTNAIVISEIHVATRVSEATPLGVSEANFNHVTASPNAQCY